MIIKVKCALLKSKEEYDYNHTLQSIGSTECTYRIKRVCFDQTLIWELEATVPSSFQKFFCLHLKSRVWPDHTLTSLIFAHSAAEQLMSAFSPRAFSRGTRARHPLWRWCPTCRRRLWGSLSGRLCGRLLVPVVTVLAQLCQQDCRGKTESDSHRVGHSTKRSFLFC